MIDNSREYIICAAIWYRKEWGDDISPRGFVAQNLRTGIVVGQWRHPNVIHAYHKLTGKRTIGEVQGFITSKGNFVDRVQAMEIAYQAGQVTKEKAFRKNWNGKYKTALGAEPEERFGEDYQFNILYSEDIY